MSRRAAPVAAGTAWPRDLQAEVAERVVDAAGDIVLVLDAGGSVVDARAHDGELHKAIRREWRGRAWADTVTVESRDKLQQLLDAASAGKAAEWRQLNHAVKGGPDLPVLYTVLRVAGGPRSRTAELSLAIGRDLRGTVALQRQLIDSQQAVERDYWRLRELEARYRNLFQTSAEAVLIVDGSNLRVTEANPAAMAMLEATRGRAARVVGGALAGLFEPDAADSLAAALAAARSIGKHEPLTATLAGSRQAVTLAIHLFRQQQSAFLLVRLLPRHDTARGREGGARAQPARPGAGAAAAAATAADGMAAAWVRHAVDALAFTDSVGRVQQVNRAFVRMAQLSSEEQARGEMLDRWLGRTGVELSVMLATLRDNGSISLFATELRGETGARAEVEVSASALGDAGLAVHAFSIRDVGRRSPGAEPGGRTAAATPQQMAELVGKVPLKQLVAESSDLIERLAIEAALATTRDNRALAAQLLGLSRQSLYVKLRRYGLGDLPGDEDA